MNTHVMLFLSGAVPLCLGVLQTMVKGSAAKRMALFGSFFVWLSSALVYACSRFGIWETWFPTVNLQRTETFALRFSLDYLWPSYSHGQLLGIVVFLKILLWVHAAIDRSPRSWFWPMADGLLTLHFFSYDTTLSVVTWHVLAILAVGYLALEIGSSDDFSSDYLLKLLGLCSLGFMCLEVGLFQYGQTGLKTQNALHLVTLGGLVLSLGFALQFALESPEKIAARTPFIFGAVFGLPACVFLQRCSAVCLPSPSDIGTLLLAFILAVAGISSLFSKTAYARWLFVWAAAISVALLTVNLRAAVATENIVALLGGPLVLLAALPRTLNLERVSPWYWLSALGSRLERGIVASALLASVTLFAGLPFGGFGFPFYQLQQSSILAGVLALLGILSCSAGLFLTLTGAWFAEEQWKWPWKSLIAKGAR